MAGIYFKQVQLLLKRLSICYLFYFLSRVLFFVANLHSFYGTGLFSFLADCFYGLRFDSFSIVISNSLFILLSLTPFKFFTTKTYQFILLLLFMLCNSLFLAFNFIDVAYYPFIHKRASSEIFSQMGGQSDLFKLIPQFAIDFWWILLLFIASIFGMRFLYKKIEFKVTNDFHLKSLKHWLLIKLQFLLVIAFAVLAVRGGLQRVPIDIVNAGAVASVEEVPIVLNSPFTIIKSMNQTQLVDYHFYTEKEAAHIYQTIHHYKDADFKKMNVVVLILESFSKEYTQLSGKRSITPFLDSLMNQSLVFSNSFSNGTKSIEGIPAILCSLPSLMENPFINSVYANNYQTSFATLLKKEGYTTAFFHGGINGTMNFTDWAPLSGYQNYFGKNEYNNELDFDGFWGIWDEPFLQYSIREMNAFKQPFHSAIFTLSSHHPYKIPKTYQGKFPKTPLENSESIGYADHSLKMFFEAAKKTSWYNNTLFILCADHASISESLFFSNPTGNLTIPVLFFNPDNSLKGTYAGMFSQMDILPSAMQTLGYSKPFFAFGESYATPNPHRSYYYSGGSHEVHTDSMVYAFNDLKLKVVYNYKRDSTLSKNLIGVYPDLDALEIAHFKAFIQTYHHCLIHNTGIVR